MHFSVSRRFFLSFILFACAIILVSSYFSVVSYKGHFKVSSDFSAFYESVHGYLNGRTLYAPELLEHYFKQKGVPLSHNNQLTYSENINPPFVSILLSPLAFFSYEHAFMIWTLTSLIASLFGLYLLKRTLFPHQFSFYQSCLFLLALLAYFPTYASISYGQFGLIIFALVCLAWWLYRNHYDGYAGLLLGLMAGIKLFFGLFFFLFLLRRKYRAIVLFIIGFFATVFLGLWYYGLLTYYDYSNVIQTIDWYSASWNASLLGFITKLSPLSSITWRYYMVFFGFMLFSIFYILQKGQYKRETRIQRDIDYAIVIVGMFLLSPLGWLYYFPSLLLPFFILFSFSQRYQLSRVVIFLGLLAFTLSNFPLKLEHHQMPHYLNLFKPMNFGFYGLIGLLMAFFILKVQTSRDNLNEQSKMTVQFPFFAIFFIYLPSFLCIVLVIPHVIYQW